MLRGDKLRMLRLYKHIRQGDIADMLGITRNYVSMMENEKKPIPKELYERWIACLNSMRSSK